MTKINFYRLTGFILVFFLVACYHAKNNPEIAQIKEYLSEFTHTKQPFTQKSFYIIIPESSCHTCVDKILNVTKQKKNTEIALIFENKTTTDSLELVKNGIQATILLDRKNIFSRKVRKIFVPLIIYKDKEQLKILKFNADESFDEKLMQLNRLLN